MLKDSGHYFLAALRTFLIMQDNGFYSFWAIVGTIIESHSEEQPGLAVLYCAVND